ncbi:N-acyl homoserine lactonase family protein [Neobacillus niacini]|uniref:N-acyl homoserine lactonase family protein n=1 Tax=Neobacillus niacini TaxID=86668 RepID=UPI002FFFE748
MFELYPVHVATLKGIDKSAITALKDPGVKIDGYCIAWIIKSQDSVYIVDPGPGCDTKRAFDRHHRHLVVENHSSIEMVLEKLRIDKSRIKAIINTHLHWDHCIANDCVKDIPIIIQKKEFDYAMNPLPRDKVIYETDFENKPVTDFNQRFSFVEGDYKIEEGLDLIFLPGHTPGHQGVKVSTLSGNYLISGDQFDLYENYELCHPVGIYVNLFDWYDSYNKIRNMEVEVIPAHDPQVFEKGNFEKI